MPDGRNFDVDFLFVVILIPEPLEFMSAATRHRWHFACFQPQATSNGIILYTFRSTSSGPSHLWEDKKQNRKQKHTHTSIKKDLKHSPFPPEIHVKVFDFLQHCPLDLGLGICTILDLVRTLVWASLSFLLPTSSAPLRTASVKVQLKLWW